MSSPQVLETVERLGEAVRAELTTLEEVLSERVELVAATRGARRQAEAVAQHLQGLAFWQGVSLSPVQVAEDVTFVEEYRWENDLFFFFKHCSLTLVPGGMGDSVWGQFYLPHWGSKATVTWWKQGCWSASSRPAPLWRITQL